MPNLRLAFLLAKLLKDHGGKILHGGRPDLLTEDLGRALQKQKDVLSDPDKGTIMTAYDVLPVILEVKILTFAVARQLDIPTKDKSDIQILEAIITASKENGHTRHTKQIQDTLEWTRALFSNPEIQDVLKMEMTDIERPKNIGDVGRFFKQLGNRSKDELARIQQFLVRTKEQQNPPPGRKKNGPTAF